ncbi:MAG TPA: SGNH/GDSL hydrolase family protein [Jatrophihabitantaceae bacterium]|nr:SGNH/GDSL hydrolase family protein [Jatrophihabitantaceae bacterium]
MHRRALPVLAALCGVVALVIAVAPAAAAAGANYVALGDSYSSGVGAGDYTAESGDCDRSPNAYSALWAANNAPASYVSVACSGATTADVANSQLPALSASTTLVSITVGGNDENFAGIMEDCNLYSDDTCVSEIQAAEDDAQANLPGKLDTLYGAIRSDAPNANVVVLDYPDFYDLANDCVGLSQTKRAKIDEGINLLDSITGNAANAAGFGFADVRGAFTGHEICDDNRWLHSVNFSDFSESYHPTADGHSQAYYPTFSAYAG